MINGDGYVAAAYLVFLALVLIYVVIMAIRLTRLERELTDINDRLDEREALSADRPREPEAVS
jgi:hypothetical protein